MAVKLGCKVQSNQMWGGVRACRIFIARGMQLSALLVLPLLLSGCLTPVQSEIPLAQGDLSVKATNTNDTKLLIFNDSDHVLYGLDGSGRINVKLNGKGVAQLHNGQYLQVILQKGSYRVDLAHLDMVKFSSKYQIELTNSESFLEIRSTPTSNHAEIVPALPPNFERDFSRMW